MRPFKYFRGFVSVILDTNDLNSDQFLYTLSEEFNSYSDSNYFVITELIFDNNRQPSSVFIIFKDVDSEFYYLEIFGFLRCFLFKRIIQRDDETSDFEDITNFTFDVTNDYRFALSHLRSLMLSTPHII